MYSPFKSYKKKIMCLCLSFYIPSLRAQEIGSIYVDEMVSLICLCRVIVFYLCRIITKVQWIGSLITWYSLYLIFVKLKIIYYNACKKVLLELLVVNNLFLLVLSQK